MQTSHTSLTSEQMTHFFRQMVRMKHLEKQLTRLSQTGQLRGSLHLATGQEAVPVGSMACLDADDFLTCTYRGHGYVMAKGVPLEKILAEVLGRSNGLCRGYGGKMHLFDQEYGVLGTNGIVGAAVGTACGAALAAKIDGTTQVAVTVFGDGAINQGHVMECFNMAVLYQLPVIFLCENNLYAEMTPLERSHGNTNLQQRAAGFGIRTASCDGNDVLDVHRVVSEAVQVARTGGGPSFIEAFTYRTIGHYQADPGTAYRTEAEVEQWKQKSPIERLRPAILDADQIEQEVEDQVASIVASCLASPIPDGNDLSSMVFAASTLEVTR